MARKIQRTTLTILVGIFACSCSEDVPTTFLLKAEVDNFSEDRWVIVSDENGHVLDYQQFVTQGEMTFEGPPSGKLIYTTFDKTVWGYILNSTQAIPIGTALPLDTTTYPANSNPPVAGDAAFNITNMSINTMLDEYYLLSSVEFGARYWTHSVFGLISPSYQNSTLTFGLELQSDPADVLGIGYRDGMPVYQWFRNVHPGDTITESFASFLPSKIIPINKKVVNFGVVGVYGDYFNEGKGYSLSRWANWYYSASSDKSKIPMPGYIDGFDNYIINVDLNGLGLPENTTFESFGPVPTSIDLPDYTYQLKNSSFSDFSFSFSNDYTYQTAFFTVDGKPSSQTNIWWWVNAPAGDKLVQIQIPSEILSKYPDFKTDQLKVNILNLVKELGGESYGDVFFNQLKFRKHYQKLTYQFLYN